MNKRLLIPCLLLSLHPGIPDTAAAESPGNGIGWWNTYGGRPGWDECSGLAECLDGGFLLAGFTDAWTSEMDAFLVRTDQYGNPLWDSRVGGDQADEAWDVLATVDGGFLVAGCTYSYGLGDGDAWLVRTDSSGSVLWSRTYGTREDDCFYSIMPVSDGCFIVAGMSGEYPVDVSMYLVKVDQEGNELWHRNYGGGSANSADFAMETPDGGFILAGKNMSNSSGSADGWLIKTDSLGGLEWDTILGGPGYDRFRHVAVSPAGGYIAVGGSGTDSGDDDDLWIVAVDQTGDSLWSRCYGEPYGSEGAKWISVAPSGGFYIAGTSGSHGWPYSDMWLLQVDEVGQFVGEDYYSGPYCDSGECGIITGDGGVVCAGSAGAYGEFDFLLVEFVPPMGGIPEAGPPAECGAIVTAHPNPCSGSCVATVFLPVDYTCRLGLYDMAGRLVKIVFDGPVQAGASSFPIDIEGVPSGVFYLRLDSGDLSASTRFVVLR